MKILRIQLKNLNSLRGRHDIDLEGDPLGTAGIFAIVGPTGGGKSTILDAMTLALYGRAARYGNQANPETMMTRHTGDCSAEVEFLVPSGRHRAVWQLRRAGNKSSGNLQPARRYLYGPGGEVIAQQIREVETRVQDLSGLDYDRFMRSVLLAQG
ncbi:MAG: AAA family ATPase, partial [Verrucomicrobiota bacterium]